MDMFDIILLIRSVKAREPIWNRQHPQYKDRDYSMMLWKEVGEELGFDADTARYKWRGLRDTFRVQLRKRNQAEKNGTANISWEYFNEMLFVKDQIHIDINRNKYFRGIGKLVTPNGNSSTTSEANIEEKGETRENSPEAQESGATLPESNAKYNLPADQSSIKSELDEDMDFQVPSDFCVAEVTEDPESKLVFNSDRMEFHEADSPEDSLDAHTSLYELRRKLRALQDDNYCFLMSILPQMKKLSTKQKLCIRIKIQELLLAEILNAEK